MSVGQSGTSGFPIGSEYWKQQAEKEEQAGETHWNVPVGKSEEEQKPIKHLKKIKPKKFNVKEKPINLSPNGANVISSKVTVYKKVEGGYEVEIPVGNEMAIRHDPLEEPRKRAIDYVRDLIPEADREEFDKNPAKYLKSHPPFPIE